MGNEMEKYLAQTSLGMYNVKIPLVLEVASFSRISTGRRVFPKLFESNTVFDHIPNNQRLDSLRQGLNSVAHSKEGTAYPELSEIKEIKYAKTGTSSKSSFLLFSTGEYSYGIMLLNSKGFPDNNKQSAKKFANEYLIPVIKQVKGTYLK